MTHPRPAAFHDENGVATPFLYFVPEGAPIARREGRRDARRDARPVREILESEDGQCFERIGNRLRRLEEVEEPEAAPQANAPLFRSIPTAQPLRTTMVFGQWRALLASQLAHPENLRDSHRIACEVRVFELSRDAGEEQVSQQLPAPVGRLDPRNAALLGLQQMMGEALPARPDYRRGERVFLAKVTKDPTRTAARPVRVPPPPSGPKNQVPECYQAPFAFLMSREEAEGLLEKSGEKNWRTRIRQWLERGERREDFAGWKRRLEGEDGESRLWKVRPPRGELASREVCEWAAMALRQAGYDATVMLREWQIYWTRKGA